MSAPFEEEERPTSGAEELGTAACERADLARFSEWGGIKSGESREWGASNTTKRDPQRVCNVFEACLCGALWLA